jgi:hypothetical protein
MSRRNILVAALALTGALSAGLAQARDDVQWSVTIGAPVYTQPVYAQPVYRHAAPVYVAPAPVYDYGRYQQPTRWDRDGDGIPNRVDPVYNPRWDRDGDGIPNRYDRWDNLRHQREGAPGWHDGRRY